MISRLPLIGKMICQRKNIYQGFLVWMNVFNDLDRLIDQFPLAIDFYLVFNPFADLSDLPFKWIRPFQRTVISLHRIDCHAMIVISDPPYSDLCKFITYLWRIFLRDEYLKFYIGEVFHGIYLAPFIILDHWRLTAIHGLSSNQKIYKLPDLFKRFFAFGKQISQCRPDVPHFIPNFEGHIHTVCFDLLCQHAGIIQ